MTVTLLCFAFTIGLMTLRLLGGRPTKITLMEYQRAVLFRRGLPLRDVGPGRHRVWTGIEKMMIVDTRPVQVSYENQSVLLRDGSGAAYSLSGSARVQDVRKALYAAGNYNHVPSFVMLCCTRLVLNSSSSFDIKTGRDALTEQIMERARPRLSAAGFELLSLRLTQLTLAQRPGE
jgi:regulator of protease activity HflC (stomatin/prohibitin superfamily)